MSCATMRERILEADLAELRGERESPLTTHLSECDACRRLARKVVDTEAALGQTLEIVASERRLPLRPRRNGRRNRWMSVAALTVAASLVVMLTRGRPDPVEPTGTMRAGGAPPLIEDTGNQNVAVFTTDDPDVVVVWFLGGTD